MSEENKPILVIHLKIRETLLHTDKGSRPTDVTACTWVNPPKERLTLDVGEVTCEQCLSAVISGPLPGRAS